MQLTQQILDGDWIVTANEMDALSNSPADDFAEPSYVGWLDYQMGLEPQPLEYYTKLGQIEEYLWGYMDAQDADDAREAREEVEWIRGGCQ